MEYILIVLSIMFFFFGAVRAVSSLNNYHYRINRSFKMKIDWIFPEKMVYAVGLVAIGWALAATSWRLYGFDWPTLITGFVATSFIIQRPLRALWNVVWILLTD